MSYDKNLQPKISLKLKDVAKMSPVRNKNLEIKIVLGQKFAANKYRNIEPASSR